MAPKQNSEKQKEGPTSEQKELEKVKARLLAKKQQLESSSDSE